MNCTITTRETDGVVIVDIVGRMSFPDPHLQILLGGLLEKGHRRYVVNLGGVTYVDSYGIHDLVMAYNAILAAGGKINLLGPNPNVKKTIQITMKTVFDIFEDEAAAVQAARS